MKIMLRENIENLGKKGDIVNVASGYGRNYLLPKNIAVEVTSSNLKMIELEQASLRKNLEKARQSYQDVIQKLNEISLAFERKTGEQDHIFGSVSVGDIKEELDKMGFEIEKKKIQLKEPIKRLGNYTIPVKVFLEDIAEIKIQVVPEGGPEEKEAPQTDTAVESSQEGTETERPEEESPAKEPMPAEPESSVPEQLEEEKTPEPEDEEEKEEIAEIDEKNKTTS